MTWIRLCTINPKSKFLYGKMTWVGQKYRIHVICEFYIALKVKIGHFWAFFAYSKPLITLIWHECGIFDLLISFFYIKTYISVLWCIAFTFNEDSPLPTEPSMPTHCALYRQNSWLSDIGCQFNEFWRPFATKWDNLRRIFWAQKVLHVWFSLIPIETFSIKSTAQEIIAKNGVAQ